ncbi:MAG: M50 family metallopeptidase [Polyangia bacterium]|jgi:regulator of sigma E protease
MSILVAIVGLALLIVLHEAGHFVTARLCGMRVERFSIGFGNALLSFKRGHTVYQIAPIPLGGFVQVTGMNPQEEFDHSDPYVYPNRPRWMRFLVLLGGPAANYLTAILIGFVVLVAYGQYTGTTTVDEVVPGSAAQAVGLRAGDIVAAVKGRPVTKPADVTQAVRSSGGQAIEIRVLRAGAPVTLAIAPRRDTSSGIYMIGVRFGQVRARGPLLAAVEEAFVMPIGLSAVLLKNIWDLITRRIEGGLTGPLGIAREMAGAAKQGTLKFLEIMILISVALGVFNLLPLPGLDGGRILFVGISSVRRREVSPAVETKIHMVGIMVLLLVLVVVTFNDIKGIFFTKIG